jgi:hypothetical protein
MAFLPSVTRAEYRGSYRVHVTFDDGKSGTIDFTPWLEGPIFEPLKDIEHFLRFLDGRTVSWPDGADIAPETLHAQARSSAAARQEDGVHTWTRRPPRASPRRSGRQQGS